MENKTYLDFIKNVLSVDGWRAADRLNKLALSDGTINQPLYSEAAREIVKKYLVETEA